MEPEDNWPQVWQSVESFVRDFPIDTVAIGGIAVYLHSLFSGDLPPEHTHDADFYVGLPTWGEMRDYYDITTNRRLRKHQTIIEGIDFDLYVQHQNNLRVDYDTLALSAIGIRGVNVAAPEHLLLLKLDALRERFASAHGRKDKRDVAKLLVMLHATPPSLVLAQVTVGDVDLIAKVMASAAFADIAGGNAHKAKALRERAAIYVGALGRLL